MATLSPLRYSGGKYKLLSIIFEYLNSLLLKQNYFCEPFVGGGSVALEVAKQYPNHILYLNDKDPWVASFWSVIIGSELNFDGLLQLMKQEPTIDLFYQLRNVEPQNEIERAYYCLFFNRTSFSGIIKPNTSPIGGKEQKSKYKVNCRYNYSKLVKKMGQCRKLLINRTEVFNYDFSEFNSFINNDFPTYIDPPYFAAGKELYTKYMIAEEYLKLKEILSSKNNWVLSLDDCQEIREVFKEFNLNSIDAQYCIRGKKDNWVNDKELIILPK